MITYLKKRVMQVMRMLAIIVFCFRITDSFSQEPLKIKIAKPDEKCTATLLGRTSGTISAEELKICNAISVKGPCDYKVVSFLFACNLNGRLFEITAKEGYFPAQVKGFLMSLSNGDKFFIENIKVKSNITGQIFSLPPLSFKVAP